VGTLEQSMTGFKYSEAPFGWCTTFHEPRTWNCLTLNQPINEHVQVDVKMYRAVILSAMIWRWCDTFCNFGTVYLLKMYTYALIQLQPRDTG